MDQIARKKRQKRVRSKIFGTATKPRLNVYKSLVATYAQLINDETGTTIIAFNDLKSKKGTKMENAKELGLKIAEFAKKEKITTCIFDRAGYKYHGRIKAVAEGAREAGLQF